MLEGALQADNHRLTWLYLRQPELVLLWLLLGAARFPLSPWKRPPHRLAEVLLQRQLAQWQWPREGQRQGGDLVPGLEQGTQPHDHL